MTRILAVGTHNDSTALVDSHTGEVLSADALAKCIAYGPGGILAGTHLYRYVGALNQTFHEFDGWKVQVRAKRRELLRGEQRHVIGSFLPIQFGFAYNNSKQGGQNAKRCPPRIFHCMDLEDITGVQSVDVHKCFELAQSILSLCEERGVRFTASRGGLATRLLKASPYWEPERKAAPEFVNDKARLELPGNYYGLGASTTKTYKKALYVDQVSAHHTIAACIPIPNPVYARARGNHRLLERGIIQEWTRQPSDVGGYGLLACMVSVGSIPNARKHLFPPFMHEPGRRLEYIYTNELHYFDGQHGAIEYVVAAWTSPQPDQAVREYARWALQARKEGPGRKGLLLAAYGALALRSDRPTTTYYANHPRGMRTFLPGAGPMSEVTRVRKEGQPQSTIVNVLARGIIEAETRARTIRYARELDASGIPVLSLYVDGIIAETDSLPLLPPGWVVESAMTNLRFSHPTSFVADEMAKQPGVPSGPSSASKMMLAAGRTIRRRSLDRAA